MRNVAAIFCQCISDALPQFGVVYHDFNKARGYRFFKMDLDSYSGDPIEIAAAALAELCIGVGGPMDEAVISAVFDFLDQAIPALREEELRALGHSLSAIFPADRSEYRDVIRKWCGHHRKHS